LLAGEAAKKMGYITVNNNDDDDNININVTTSDNIVTFLEQLKDNYQDLFDERTLGTFLNRTRFKWILISY
jgi:hypothetical protein